MKLDIRHSGLRKLLVAGAASVGLLLSGCDAATFYDPDAVTMPETTEAVDLISTAEAAGSFTTLLAAIEAAGLRDVLSDRANNYTIFAPTDSAFEALGQESVNALLADSEALNDTLLYHVLAGVNDADAVTALAGQTITMLNDKTAAVVLDADQLKINTSTITATDIVASNGIIHIIDAVLTPTEDAVTPVASDNLTQVLSNDPQFTTLSSALSVTGLDATLGEEGAFTVFAPNNAAFDALGEETVNALIADPDTLRDIILYHVVENEAIDSTTAIAAAGTNITSAIAAPLAVSLSGDTLMINNASVVRADIAASNGVIHEIDGVLQQPSAAPMTIVDVLSAKPDYSSIVSLIQTAGLADTLRDVDSSFTIFAPNNAALAAAETELAAGYTSDPAALAALLLGHVHGATLSSTDVIALDGTPLLMANGTSQPISVFEGAVMFGPATVIDPDMAAQNGVIHGIDMVIID